MSNIRYFTKNEIVAHKESVGISLNAEYGNKLVFSDGTSYALDIITGRYYFCNCGWI